MNKVILIGRLTQNPELKAIPGNGTLVANFTLAVNRNFKNAKGEYEADFINCICFNKLAETIANNLTKGRQIAVEGRLQVRNYEAKDGTKRYITEVVVNEMQFLDKKQNENSQSNKEFVEVNENEEVPF